MQQNKKAETPAAVSSYREMHVGGTLYRVTSVYLGQKDLRDTLERLVAKRVYDKIVSGADSRP